jgi:hypothetical protein
VGSTRPEREYSRARGEYLTAAARLAAAMTTWEAAQVPLQPGPRGELEPWTQHQVRVTVAAAEAWQQLVWKRKAYDACAREVAADRLPLRPDRRQ